MSKGENIFKRKDGRWEARYIKGYELSGKIKYGFCYGKTYKEAKEKVTKFKVAMASGSPLPAVGSRHRFAFYCDEWLRLRKTKVKEATYIKYDTALEKHIKPRLGGCFPLGITSGLIDDFTKELLLEEELAPKTVHDILVVLHGVLKYTATRFPGVFPTIEINYPKSQRKEMRVLSREEQQRFIAYLLTDRAQQLFRTPADAGRRPPIRTAVALTDGGRRLLRGNIIAAGFATKGAALCLLPEIAVPAVFRFVLCMSVHCSRLHSRPYRATKKHTLRLRQGASGCAM